MNDMKGSKVSQETSTQEVRVKPEGLDRRADSFIASQLTESLMFGNEVMESICERVNLIKALKRVKSNRGSAGIDGMTVEELPAFLKEHWPCIKEQLLKGVYVPKPVKRLEIPKPGSREVRKLGIPCALDRFIQQAVLQVLQAKWDRTFSDFSFGFRPNRSAHQAISQAQSYVREGYKVVVDIDIEKFFDRVCHDRLMSRLAGEIEDKRVLKLIRAYLKAGIMENGLISTPTQGTPQGGPLSPFLSNVVLDELDKELENRGHRFVRYADDCNIYVKSVRAGDRVMCSISRFIAHRLKLKANEQKSAVGSPQQRKFLGFTFTGGKQPNRRKIAPESLKRFKSQVRRISRRNRGWHLQKVIDQLSRYLEGWKGYYGYCETPTVLRDLDSWIRRRMRSYQWKQWKTYANRTRQLIRRNVPVDLAHKTAWSAKGPWRMSHTQGVQMALPTKYFDSLGLTRLSSC
jgi:RNA-directed DNA polymerase